MRTHLTAVCCLVLALPAHAEPLSPSDREMLIENLDKLNDTVMEKVDARYRAAITAYRAAMQDEGAAVAFYLKCVEKVNFDDQKRRPAEFREWKKRQDEMLGEPSTKRAFMYQLRWLILTLRASSDKANLEELGREGLDALEDLFRDTDTLLGARKVLEQSVVATPFAKAYEIDRVKESKWPPAILSIGSFFNDIVLPKYRATADITKLRAGWTRRIGMEATLHERPAATRSKGHGREGQSGGDPSPEEERFATEILPDLIWQMEADLFRAGDQRTAARNMIAHIQKHIASPKAKDWTKELRDLLTGKTTVTDGKPADTPATGTTTPAPAPGTTTP